MQSKGLRRVVGQKTELEAQLQNAKAYSRKLEGHITSGSKGQHVTEVNVQLREQLTSVKRELQHVSQVKAELEEKSDEKDAQLKILSRALDIKAEELGLRGDMRATLLFDLGQSRTELERTIDALQSAEAETARLSRSMSEAKTTIEELKLIRHSNNEELNTLEAEAVELRQDKEALEERLSDLEEENRSLLDYIDEISQKCKGLEQSCKRSEQELQQVKAVTRKKKDASVELDVLLHEATLRYEAAEDKVAELEDKLAQVSHQSRQEATSIKQQMDASAEFEGYREEFEAEKAELKAVVKELSEELVKAKEIQRHLQAEHDSQLNEAERQITELQETASATEEVLKLKLERALADIEELVEEREHMREAMNEAISQCAATMISQQATDREKQRRLFDSKAPWPLKGL